MTNAANLLPLLLFLAFPAHSQGSLPVGAPEPPRDEWYGLPDDALEIDLRTGRSFGLGVHAEMTPKGKECANELSYANYLQDVGHAFNAQAHFDNCAFEEGLSYIQSLIESADEAFKSKDASSNSVKKGMRFLGQALHAVQDFYAHSNYVELSEANSALQRLSDIPILDFWTRGAKRKTFPRELLNRGLVSGVVWWNRPQQCRIGTKTHAELAKDGMHGPGKESSRFKTEVGSTQTRHAVAKQLAVRATEQFLAWSASQWPQIRRTCGAVAAFTINSDRRQADIPLPK